MNDWSYAPPPVSFALATHLHKFFEVVVDSHPLPTQEPRANSPATPIGTGSNRESMGAFVIRARTSFLGSPMSRAVRSTTTGARR